MGEAVRQMFAAIAQHYDRLNSVLSFGLHHRWRWQAVRCSGIRPGAQVLDLCSGTADLALTFARHLRGEGAVIATDFCQAMLVRGVHKATRQRVALGFALADAQSLPFCDTSFDCVSVAFGLRNVDCLAIALREMYRVLRPGGVALVLEFGQPQGVVFGPVYRWYARHILPRLGAWVSGHGDAYTYLPRTAAVFPAGARFVREVAAQGFTHVQAQPLTGGIVYLYTAIRPA
jgi:demethylmenaquinone methyltransferase / 2-methoxy-6-polyprenyl-1,4-benzoquinol methylase